MSNLKKKMAPMWNSDSSYVDAISPEQKLMPFEVVNNRPIQQFQNGRVVGVSDMMGNSNFDMFTHNNNKADTAKQTILYGTINRTSLSDTFFSDRNMKNIQDMLRYNIYIASGGEYQIGNQNNTDLQIIMRAIYLQHSKHLPTNIKGQVDELNRYVIEFSVPKVLSEIKQYIHYVHQLETLPNPIDLPRNVSSIGTKTLRSVTTTF